MILDLVCKRHPKYEAVRYPVNKRFCNACMILYLLKNKFVGNEVGVEQIGTFYTKDILINRSKS